MDTKLKNAIQEAFAAPPPDRKQKFLAQITYDAGRHFKWREFIMMQAGYIHKGAWLCALAIFCAVLYIVANQDTYTVFAVSALTPFLALAVLIESNRSKRYNMEELEAATYVSLRSVVFCRMWILGVFDLIVLIIIIAITGWRTRYGLLLTAAYILLPYLLTMWIGMLTERTRIGRESPYAAVGISMMVAVGILVLTNSDTFLMKADYGMIWEFLCVALIGGIVVGGKKKLQALEEPLWN